MNCVEFRRQLAIDPRATAGADSRQSVAQHRAECPRCAEACARALAFEDDLARALAVAVPEQLAESILLAQTTAERRRRAGLRRVSIFAAAAVLVLAVGVVGMRAEAKPLSVQAVEHLESEPSALASTRPIPSALVVRAFAARHVSLRQVPDAVSYAQPCPIGEHRSVHVVMRTAQGPVTVIYIADKKAATSEDFDRAGLAGRALPAAGGTLILLAKSRAEFDHIGDLWRAAIAD
ncbi:MAG: DUF3379 family protein [Rudaea sp.]|uniref:DUF3379 family protein n=1 Tax=Rudaea sp. TaxID=2136325 RepID=UPI0039E60629